MSNEPVPVRPPIEQIKRFPLAYGTSEKSMTELCDYALELEERAAALCEKSEHVQQPSAFESDFQLKISAFNDAIADLRALLDQRPKP